MQKPKVKRKKKTGTRYQQQLAGIYANKTPITGWAKAKSESKPVLDTNNIKYIS